MFIACNLFCSAAETFAANLHALSSVSETQSNAFGISWHTTWSTEAKTAASTAKSTMFLCRGFAARNARCKLRVGFAVNIIEEDGVDVNDGLVSSAIFVSAIFVGDTDAEMGAIFRTRTGTTLCRFPSSSPSIPSSRFGRAAA